MGDMNSLLVDAIAEYMRMNGRGMVFSPEIERMIGRPLGRDINSAQPMAPQRQSVIDALKNINAAPMPARPAAPIPTSNGLVRG